MSSTITTKHRNKECQCWTLIFPGTQHMTPCSIMITADAATPLHQTPLAYQNPAHLHTQHDIPETAPIIPRPIWLENSFHLHICIYHGSHLIMRTWPHNSWMDLEYISSNYPYSTGMDQYTSKSSWCGQNATEYSTNHFDLARPLSLP